MTYSNDITILIKFPYFISSLVYPIFLTVTCCRMIHCDLKVATSCKSRSNAYILFQTCTIQMHPLMTDSRIRLTTLFKCIFHVVTHGRMILNEG
jgi:hypothetical protein